MEEGNGSALDVPEAEFWGGGQRLAEELPGSLGVSGLAAGEEHPGPLQTGASQPGGGLDPLVGECRSGEVGVGLVVAAERGGEQT